MKTKQVMVYLENGENFIKLLKHCDLFEKIILYSIKEIVKQYFAQFGNFSFEGFKSYFDTQWNQLLIIDCVLSKSDCCAINDKIFVLGFYYMSGNVKKSIQVTVKL